MVVRAERLAGKPMADVYLDGVFLTFENLLYRISIVLQSAHSDCDNCQSAHSISNLHTPDKHFCCPQSIPMWSRRKNQEKGSKNRHDTVGQL